MTPHTFSFGPFEFDPISGRLTKYGHRIKLQPKSATILGCLLERAGELVRRTELRKALWPEGTYVDFDLGIKTAVKKLREALGDAAGEPAYVQTVYGEGFRFIATVARTGGLAEAAPAEPIVVNEAVPESHTESRRPIYAIAVLTGIALLMSSSSARPPRLPFQNRDWVVIAAFENRTGEGILDGSLEFALANELMRSTYVNVAPPDRISDALRLMRISPDSKLTESLARQVAVRDGGIKTVIAGRVERFGPKYVLTERLVEPTSGMTAAVVSRETSENDLPAAARSAAQELRRKLGESKIGTVTVQLERATTPSLAALHTFSSAMRLVNAGKWPEAAELMEEATRQDPQFALAHIYAAHSYSNLNLEDRAAPHYQAAYKLANAVSDRERLFILGSYYERFLHNDPRALATYQALLQIYPDDYWSTHNSMVIYVRLGGWESKGAVEMRERMFTLRPNDSSRPSRLREFWWKYRRLEPNETKARFYRTQLENGLRSGQFPAYFAKRVRFDFDLEPVLDRWQAGNVQTVARDVARLTSKALAQSDDDLTSWVALTNLGIGRLEAVRSLCGRIRSPDRLAYIRLRLAYVREDNDLCRRQLMEARTGLPEGDLFAIALAAKFGDMDLARNLAGNDPQFREPLLIVTGHPQVVRGVWPYRIWFTLWHRMALADALETNGKPDEAIKVLSEETRPAILNFGDAWNWPQCRMKLAALLRKHGRVQEAVEMENEIRHFLAAADADHPMLAHLRGLPMSQASASQ